MKKERQILFEGKYWQTRTDAEVNKYIKTAKSLGMSDKEINATVRNAPMKQTLEQAADSAYDERYPDSENGYMWDRFSEGAEFGANWQKQAIIDLIDEEIAIQQQAGSEIDAKYEKYSRAFAIRDALQALKTKLTTPAILDNGEKLK